MDEINENLLEGLLKNHEIIPEGLIQRFL